MKNKFIILLIWPIIYICNIAAEPYVFKHLGVKDGLSNNYVVDIVQDKQGCIWIATDAGLNMFDGNRFIVYNTNNSDIKSNSLNALFYDEEENELWIGTKSGLSVYNCTTMQFENDMLTGDLAALDINNISSAADTGIWITNFRGHTIHYNKKNRVFTQLPNEEIKELDYPKWCTYDDGNGCLFIGHARNGLSIIDSKNKTVKNFVNDPNDPNSLPGNSVYTICIDHTKNIWIGTNLGLALYNPKTESFLVFKHEDGNPNSMLSDHIYRIKEMNDGTLWIGSDIGGISILDLRDVGFIDSDKLQFHNIAVTGDKYGLSSGNIRSLLQDSYGNIWVGSYSTGIDFISHTQPVFHTIPYMTDKGGMPKSKPVWDVYADEKGLVWVGSENEIAVFKDNILQNKIDLTPHLSRPYGRVLSIEGGSKGDLFLGIYDDGLLRLDIENNKVERIKLDIDYIDIFSLFRDVDERMWIGSEYGIYTYENGIVRFESEIVKQLNDISISGFIRDHQEKLWIATHWGGITVFDENEKCIHNIGQSNGFCSNSINDLFIDSNGGIWAATWNGLGYIKDTNHPERFELYGYEHGLKNVCVRAIHEDATGNIWISTDNGISFLDMEKHKFDNYDFRDGIPEGNFNNDAVGSLSNGTLYFGSLDGVCYFDPQELSREPQIAPVRIIECKGFNRQTESRKEEFLIVPENDEINLPYNNNSFRISFSVPDYSQSYHVEYAYMMEGLDDSWYNTHGEHQITFRNLPYGKYQFKVKARMKNKNWDEANIASMTVYIHPPFWLTWYAKLFYVIVFCFSLFILLRSYKNKLSLKSSLELERKESRSKQELNDERLRFYTNITHELRTPLTLILGPLEDLVCDSGLSTLYKSKITIIYDSAIRLLNLINQILEFRKTETQNRKLTVKKGDLGRLVTETGLRYKELNQNKNVMFSINIETDDTILYYDTDMIVSILNNLLSNAVKYTPEGEVKLTLRSVTEKTIHYTEIEVSDTGYGIDKESLLHIFERYYQAKSKHQASGTGIGLALVKSLVDLHEGALSVKSTVGQGSTFTLRLLTENVYPDALHDEEKYLTESKQGIIVAAEDSNNDLPTALIVEDNVDIRDYIATSLAPEYNIITAINGKEGLDSAQRDIPDIIVSDIMMPEIDGIEFCRFVKEDIRTSHIPVILLTAKDSIYDKEVGYKSGADSYLTKPFSARLLLSRIHNILDSRKRLVSSMTANNHKPFEDDNLQYSIKISQLDEEFLAKLTALIEDNLDMEKLDISFLKEKVNMSHSTFYRKVKGLTGISANEFIRKVRLKNSLQLLLSGSYNVSEAAYKTGFNDMAYFRQCFKEEYGMSPSEYLKKNKSQF